jgi:hypothetical protein
MIPRITYTSEMLDEFITFITDAHRELTSQDEEKADEGSDDDEVTNCISFQNGFNF